MQAPTLIGQLVADRYRVLSKLGEGGAGVVYLANQERLERPVALKVLLPDLNARDDMAERFQREAKAASMLQHPGSVVVHDFGSWEGHLYIAMEYIDGPTLADVLHASFPLGGQRIGDLAIQIAEVLVAAHRVDLLHRDLKPDNVLIANVDGREEVRIVDFGLAFLLELDQTRRLTLDGTVAGTPAYMSPEQALSRPLTPQSDVYGFGCLLYELLAGVPPFDGPAPLEVLTQQVYDAPEPPSRRVMHPISETLEAIALWCLQKRPADRPDSAAMVVRALIEARDARPDRERSAALMQRLADRVDLTWADPAQAPAAKLRDHSVLVYQARFGSVADSCVSVLRGNGIRAQLYTASGPAPNLAELDADAIIVDVREAPPKLFRAVERWLADGALGGRPLVVFGPDDAYELMHRALRAGATDFVTEAALADLPARLARAISRGARDR